MKKLSKISLHNLSKVGLADKEMNMLRGGSGALCWVVCTGTVCRCVEDGSGEFSSEVGIAENNENPDASERELNKVYKEGVSG